MSLAKIGQFLMTRFPEKLEVKKVEWEAVNDGLASVEARLLILENNVELVLQRLSTVETSAVHKGAVADLVTAVKGYKDELAAVKVGLGLSRIGDTDIQAMLNGLPIPSSEDK